MNTKSIIRDNSKKFRLRKCPQHQLSHFQKVCAHSNCIDSMALSFLCNQCFRKHPENHHNGMIQYFLEFDKIFSENVFTDIELLENVCLSVLLEKQQRIDDEIDRNCDNILEGVKQSLELIKFRIKQKYGTDSLIDTVSKLKESLKIQYNTLFLIDETNIRDNIIKQYLEFYLNFEKILEQNQAKSEEIYKSIGKELSGISQLFNKILKDIKLVLESDVKE